jgi:Tol biopolymer transport system component
MQHATIISPAKGATSRRRCLSRRRVFAVAAGGTVAAMGTLLGTQRLHGGSPSPATARLEVTSEPSGAMVVVDGYGKGRTPLSLALQAGRRQVVLQHAGAIPATATVQTVQGQTFRLSCTLWRTTPTAQPLQAPMPGTTLVDADFLTDGCVVLLARSPVTPEYSLWRRIDGGVLQRLGPVSTVGPSAARPDGVQVAYLDLAGRSGTATGVTVAPLTALWTASADGSAATLLYALSPQHSDERLTGLTWSPNGQQVLLIAHRDGPGGALDRLLCLHLASGAVQTLTELPSTIVPGSGAWAPDLRSVAFLTQTGPLVSLCLIDLRTQALRYLADLSQRDPAALPFAPLAWSPDGQQIVYAAAAHEPARGLGGLLLGDQSVDVLYTAGSRTGEGRPLDSRPASAPVWRPGGDILALARQSGGGVQLDQFTDPKGRVAAVGALPLTVATPFAVRWDVAHAQALLLQHAASGLQGWLLSFRLEAH